MKASQESFQSAGHRLVGTLIEPAEPGGPVALLVSGSGPIDRDSNMKRMRLDAMRQVAEALAEHGIGTFRYDKRGIGDSEGDYHATGLHDNVADARAALEMVRQQFSGSEVTVVGHSEGALIATELAAVPDGPDAIVLLAGAAQPGKEILRWQARQLEPSVPRLARGILKLLRKDIYSIQKKRLAQLEATTEDVTRIQFVKVNAKWFREFMAHDPSPSLKRITCDVLALTGDKDIQVDPADVARMRDLVAGRFDGETVADLTHILRKSDRPPSVRDYKKLIKHPVDEGVLRRMTDWILDPSTRGKQTDDAV